MIKFRQLRLVFYQLCRPLSYLQIKHNDKWIYDWLLPILFTTISCSVIFLLIPIETVVGADGLISELTDFVSNLPGFFIAALAAVATFNKNDIDELMANPPKIEIFHHGSYLMVEMTRRRFLCVLFSYLTATSIFLVIFTKFALAVHLPSNVLLLASWVGACVYLFVLWQMILATVLGLYYLGERLHTPQ
jgi:hypothetical protein